MRKSRRLLAAIALIALLLAPGVPIAAEPVAQESWGDLQRQVQDWLEGLVANLTGHWVAATDDERMDPDVRPETRQRLREDRALGTAIGHDEGFPGMDPDG
jgi:hypothetical protein